MDVLQLVGFLKEWKEAGLLMIAVWVLWKKTEHQEKKIAGILDEYTGLIKESVKHIERNTAVLIRLEKDGNR